MNFRLFRDPFAIAALVSFFLSIWVGWPVLTLKTYPHFPFVRGYGAMFLMVLANSLAHFADDRIKK